MSSASKILPMDQLAELVCAFRADSKRIVHCHGVFDLLHIGHIRYLQKARRLGDMLVVTLTADGFVNKGPHRPAFQQELRVSALAALEDVDYVAINDGPTAAEVIRRLRPDVYAKGAEFRNHKTPELLQEESAAAEVGARVEYIEDITSSSSHLINNYLNLFSPEVEQYLGRLKQKYATSEILGWLDKIGSLKVLVVGETIIDEYYNCHTLGRSSKAPIVAAQYDSHERFAGGALAVANHLSSFCDRVEVVTLIGNDSSHEEWLRTQLEERVEPTFIRRQAAPTIVKRRYRESYFTIPLFEIYFMNDRPLSELDDKAVCGALDTMVADYDLVVVADYGHSMLGEKARCILCDRARFLAVNTQKNAGNSGFHTIGKYGEAQFISLADDELRLECRDVEGDAREMLKIVAKRHNCRTVAVTLGSRGCLVLDASHEYEAPALALNVVDRVGAGDAFFAITSLCATTGAPADVLAFLGNVAGAKAVAVVGHSEYLSKQSIQRHVDSLLK